MKTIFMYSITILTKFDNIFAKKQPMYPTFLLRLNNKLFLRDPVETEMGRKILYFSTKLIDKVGLEHFTFKRLAQEMDSTEATLYKYFQNKYKLLVYLISWYWVWLDYKIDFEIHNIKDPVERIKIIIKLISQPQEDDPSTFIDEGLLHNIVVFEGAKAYLTKDVDENNRDGLFQEYKSLCRKIASIILEVCPSHSYAHSLVSTIIETAHQQMFFANHLPSLSDVKKSGDLNEQLVQYLEHLVFSSIGHFKNIKH